MVDLLNDDLGNFVFHDEIDDISQSCYEHWLASSENACEIRPMVVGERLSVGPLETPLASDKCIYGTQIDGGSTMKGMYLIDETTVMNRSTIQPSKACRGKRYNEMLSTTYLVRIFTSSGGIWSIHPLAVYYQLRQYSGVRRVRITVASTASQTELTGEMIDKSINMRTPEG